MTAHQFISILVRVAGLAMGLLIIRQQVPYFGALFRDGVLRPEDAVALAVAIVLVVIALVMALWPHLVADKLLDGSGREVMTSAWSAPDLQKSLIVAIGLYALVEGTLNACYWIAYWAVYRDQLSRFGTAFPYSPETVGGMISTAAQMMIGLIILRNAGVIAALTSRRD